MEEFYRRKYLNPSYTRVSYVDTLEKDKTVAELRKELHDCKEMEEKFDQLCIEIVKLERENKKLEGEQSLVETEYMEKIRKNKGRITELKKAILDCRETVEERSKRIEFMETENDQLLDQLQCTKKKAEEVMREKEFFCERIETQEHLIAELQAKTDEAKNIVAQTRKENQMKSQQLENSYQQLKKSELKLKEQELQNANTRQQFERLNKEKQQRVKKIELSKATLSTVKAQLEIQQRQNLQAEQLYKQMQAEREKENDCCLFIQQELKRNVVKSKQTAIKAKAAQNSLVDCFKNFEKDQLYLQKMTVKEVQLKKGNERLEEILKNLGEILTEQQESYHRIIGHMKMSIQKDEKAIQSLSKQATLLEHMIA